MHRLTFSTRQALYSAQASRQIEQRAALALPAQCLMQRAGLASAKLVLALAPHAQKIWLACGPGNNGGDGFEAAWQLHQSGKNVVITWTGTAAKHGLPADAQASYDKALAAGLRISREPPLDYDFCVDALLGLGGRADSSPISALIRDWLLRMRTGPAPLLALDLPSGLDADSGLMQTFFASPVRHKNRPPTFCLSLLTLKPGLFTADGRDAAGQIWFDDLGVHASTECNANGIANSNSNSGSDSDSNSNTLPQASAYLLGADSASPGREQHLHASHKGSFGDVAVIGGESSAQSQMTGAALLAARAALHAGAGRVFVALLAEPGQALQLDPLQPELMFRSPAALALAQQSVVCGCGGGQAVKPDLPRVLAEAAALVLDADALNAIAADPALQTLLKARIGRPTVLTPHPLEAARLAACSTAEIQADRLAAAQALADKFGCVVLLKGSGSVIAEPGRAAHINPSGNPRLASAGTGDVLAGLIGAEMAKGWPAFEAACSAVFKHGLAADQWTAEGALTASGLLVRIG